MNPIKIPSPIFVLLVALICAPVATAEIRFSGLSPEQEANARAIMPLASTSCDSARWRIQRLFRDADGDLRKSLEALGYYDITVSKNLTWEENCWSGQFDVVLGEPIRLRQVNVIVEGDALNDAEFQTRIMTNRPAVGEVLNHGRYDSYKSSLITISINRGYFDADFERSEVVVDPATRSAEMTLKLQTGPRYRFGAVTFTQGILNQDLLAGYSDIEIGDPYSAESISRLYESLNGSTYFKSVSINTDPVNEIEKRVPVNISLTPGARSVYSIGAGFATDTGPKGRVGYANRRRNMAGHQFDSKLYASPVESELTATYRWPIRNPRNEWFNVVGGVKYEDTETSQSDTYKLGVSRSKNVAKSWLQTRYVDFNFENFKVGDQDTSSRLVILGINWETATGRELSRPKNGHRMSFDIRGASDSFGSDTSFAQLRSSAKWIHSLNDKTRLSARGSVGLTVKEDLQELPASVRFFTGGDRSVRGYEFESLGPLDADNKVIGGSHLVVGSLEIDRLFKSQWGVAAFVDSGSAFNNNDINLSTGVGIGIRWYSPVGPVKLDFAHPLDDPDSNFRFHISLGPDL